MWKSLVLCILAVSVTACHRSSGTIGDASIDGLHAVCGNSIVEGTEDCDDGANNGVVGDPIRRATGSASATTSATI